jgi:hypothetical protein
VALTLTLRRRRAGLAQRGADGLGQAKMRVGGDQRDAGRAAGGQVAEERQPPGTVLAGGHVQAQDLPVALGVHPGREQGVNVHGTAGLVDTGIGRDER